MKTYLTIEVDELGRMNFKNNPPMNDSMRYHLLIQAANAMLIKILSEKEDKKIVTPNNVPSLREV